MRGPAALRSATNGGDEIVLRDAGNNTARLGRQDCSDARVANATTAKPLQTGQWVLGLAGFEVFDVSLSAAAASWHGASTLTPGSNPASARLASETVCQGSSAA